MRLFYDKLGPSLLKLNSQRNVMSRRIFYKYSLNQRCSMNLLISGNTIVSFTVGFKIKNSFIKITNAIDIWNESVNQLRLF